MKKALASILLITCLHIGATAQPDTSRQVQTTTVVGTDTHHVSKPAILPTAPGRTQSTQSDNSGMKDEAPAVANKITSDGMTALLVLIPVVMFLLIFLVFRKELSQIRLTEALSENETSKVTVKNDQYKIEDIKRLIEKLSAGGNNTNAGSKEQAMTEAYNAAVKATKERTDAEGVLTSAKNAAAADATNEALKTAVATAQASFDAKKAAEEAAIKSLNQCCAGNQGSSISAAMLMNLATLFPPTIEVSGGTDASSTQAADNRKYRPSSSRIVAFMAGIITLVLALSMTCFFIFFYCTTGKGPDLSKLFAVIIALGLGMTPYAVNKISGVIGNQKAES